MATTSEVNQSTLTPKPQSALLYIAMVTNTLYSQSLPVAASFDPDQAQRLRQDWLKQNPSNFIASDIIPIEYQFYRRIPQ